MGALPKNKITSVERGKRRAGNTPKLKKDLSMKKQALQLLFKKWLIQLNRVLYFQKTRHIKMKIQLLRLFLD